MTQPKPMCNPAALPDELKSYAQWVVWKLVPNERDAAKLDKRPFNPGTGQAASHSDPRTWGTFKTAVEAYKSGEWAGVGFVLTRDDPYTIVDLDACFSGPDNTLAEHAAGVVAQLASFTERSQSGAGLHIIIRGPSGAGSGRKSTLMPGVKSFEVYDHTRFFALTGDRWGDTTAVRDAAAPAVALVATWTGTTDVQRVPLTDVQGHERLPRLNAHLSDAEMLMLIAQQRERLYAIYFDETPTGAPGHVRDASRDDAGLIHLLIEYTGWDEDRIERLCGYSNVKRPKWAEQRKDVTGERVSWLRYSVRRALRSTAYKTTTTENTAPLTTAKPERFGAMLDDPPQEIGWLVEGLWPQGARGWIAGEPKLGKSWIALDMAVAIATGSEFLGFGVERPAVVYYLTEEGNRWSIYKRLLMLILGRGLSPDVLRDNLRLIVRRGVKLTNARWLEGFLLDLQRDKPAMVFLDPLVRYHNANEDRAENMAPVLEAAARIQEVGPAVGIVHHMRKTSDANATARSGQQMRGTSDLHAWSDAALYCSGAKDLPDIVEIETELKDEAPPEPFTVKLSFAEEVEVSVPGRRYPIRLKPTLLEVREGTKASARVLEDAGPILAWLKARKGERFATGTICEALSAMRPKVTEEAAKKRAPKALKELLDQGCVASEKGKYPDWPKNSVLYWYVTDLPRQASSSGAAAADDLPF